MKIGIIGGAGAFASALLYQKMVEGFYAKALGIPEIVLLNYPFTRCLDQKEAERHLFTTFQQVQQCVDALAAYGVERAIIACNTLHLFFDRLNRHEIQFTHLPQLVVETLLQQKVLSILLLGTPNTIQHGLYMHSQMNLIAPSPSQQAIVGRVIDRILAGVVSEIDCLKLSEMIEAIRLESPFDAVVLGCTDLSVLHSKYPLCAKGISIVDPLQIYVKTLIQENIR